MALDKLQVWRQPANRMGDAVVRVVSISDGDRTLHVAFMPEKVRSPGYVRRQLFEMQRAHFPDYQRRAPRRRTPWR